MRLFRTSYEQTEFLLVVGFRDGHMFLAVPEAVFYAYSRTWRVSVISTPSFSLIWAKYMEVAMLLFPLEL